MAGKTLRREKLEPLLHEARGRYRLFAPKAEGDQTVLAELDKGESPVFTHRATRSGLKGLFFPRSETLFRFDGTEVFDVVEDGTPWLVFGHHPCDVSGLLMLDRVFDDPRYKDPYYLSRRERATLFTLACHRSQPTCFCTAVGGSPAGREGSDLIGTFLGDRYYVEALTDKGETFLAQFPAFFDDATQADRDAAMAQAERVAASIAWKPDLSGVKAKLDGMFDHPIWDEIQQKCVGCGVCTFVCPTCHCFDITDEAKLGSGRRVRSWDSCMFPQYSLHASGHNPRPSGLERWRQRLLHKFQQTVDRFGATFCVGCARCVRNCPVGMDIRQVLEDVLAAPSLAESEAAAR